MFGKKDRSTPVKDITKKRAKTWWGGSKTVPTTKAEQRKMKAALQKRDPNCTVIDSAYQKKHALDWVDELEMLDAIFDD